MIPKSTPLTMGDAGWGIIKVRIAWKERFG